MLNCYCREHLSFYAFCGTDITVGAQYATLTLSRCPGASIEQWEILFITQYFNVILVDNEVSHCGNNFMDMIFKFLHSIMYTLTLQISKLTKAVVLNSFPHGRFWQFAYKENVRCTRLMQRSLQVVIRQMFVLCSLKIEVQWSEPMSFTLHSALRKLNTDRTFYRCFPPKFYSFG